MKTFASLDDWRDFRRTLAAKPLGFVPTMGALHAGHLSLVEACLEDNAFTAVSIFVNPVQFDEPGDFAAYPTDTEADLKRLEAAGVDAVLLPEAAQIYPDDYRYKVVEGDFSRRLCGAHRPGHFDGVLTVVMRLLNLVRPDKAYFGEKDYQQLLLVRGMVEAFFLPVDIVGCPTVRESDGLAMSSRNRRLDAAQRTLAPSLYEALRQSASAAEASESLSEKGFEVDYVEDIPGRRLAAVRLGETRLIDNVPR